MREQRLAGNNKGFHTQPSMAGFECMFSWESDLLGVDVESRCMCGRVLRRRKEKKTQVHIVIAVTLEPTPKPTLPMTVIGAVS